MRSINQDEVGEFVNADGWRLVVVADGMGGHAGGEVASHTCVERIGEVFRSTPAAPEALLRHAFESANERIYQLGMRTPGLEGMGTTAVALLIEPGDGGAWVAHVGGFVFGAVVALALRSKLRPSAVEERAY